MPDRIQSTDPNNNKAATQLSIRTISILVMLVGAAGFVFTLVYFGREQVLCLSASTLVTLGGLGFLVTARKKGWEFRVPLPTRQVSQPPRPRRGRVPPGLRAHVQAKAPDQALIDTPEPAPQPEVAVPQPAPVVVPQGPLLVRVISQFQSQGAHVEIETQQADRSILRIHAGGGQTSIALVLEGETPVEVGDVRALNALVTSFGAGRGFLVSAGVVSQAASDYAEPRPLRLVNLQNLSSLIL